METIICSTCARPNHDKIPYKDAVRIHIVKKCKLSTRHARAPQVSLDLVQK